MIEPFRPMKPKKVEEIPVEDNKYIYQLKVDGTNTIIDVALPDVYIIHASVRQGNIAWNDRTYRFPELVREIREDIVLKDKCVYIGENTVLDGYGVGRHWLYLKRQLESNFQIQRMSKLLPVVFYPHYVIKNGHESYEDVRYEEMLKILANTVTEGDHVIPIPTSATPQPLLEQKGLIEGIVIKDRDATYSRGKRGFGWFKKKFFKEKVVKFVSFEEQKIGIKMYSDEGKPVFLSGNRVDTVIKSINENGHINCELEYMTETGIGYRDCSVKRVLSE